MEIPYITLLDLDKERYGGGWGRIKYVLKQLMNNGYSKEKLLNTTKGVLSDEQFENMNNWEIDDKVMAGWIKRLEKYNVFFSAPLDIDFLMLENFCEEYKKILVGSEGPKLMITDQNGGKKQTNVIDIEKMSNKPQEYNERIKQDLKYTLKKEGGDGSTYSEEQKRLMIWYNYFFLNRGKPSTHILALSQMDESKLEHKLPSVIDRLISIAEKLLNE